MILERIFGTLALGTVVAVAGLAPLAVADGNATPVGSQTWEQQGSAKPRPDLSGQKRVGIASFYGSEFFGREMANGEPMNPAGSNAASRTLPLGTTAKVTNLSTGKSAIVKIEDRGPYVDGRILDLSPGTARKIGISSKQGLAKVVVAPIEVPLPDGRVKLGAAGRERLASAETR